MLVAQVIGIGKCFEILDAGCGTQSPGGFIFQPAFRAPVFRLVDNGKMIFVNLGNPATGDGATETGLIGQQIGLAVTASWLSHGFSRYIVGAFKLHIAEIARRQGSAFVDDIHQNLRAIGGQAFAGNGIFLQSLLAGFG